MQRNLGPALKAVGMSVFAVIISFFVYFSLFVVINQFSTEVIGYIPYDANGEEMELVEEKPVISNEISGYIAKRSDMTAGATVLLGVLQVVCGVGIVFCTVGSVLAKEAAKDRNDADFNELEPDKLRGFKIGALASIPLLALNVIAIVLKALGSSAATFYWFYRWFALSPVKPILELMTGNANDLSTASLWSIIASIGFTVIFFVFCGVMYIICYNEDSVIAKLLYKSTKKKKENVRRLGR